MAKRALVTGAAGLVGRHMTNRLLNDGWTVAQVDPRLPELQPYYGFDAIDYFRNNEDRFDLVCHAAAHVGGRTDIEGRPTYVGAMNHMLDGAMFEWALRTRPAHVIYWSSSAAYPVMYQHTELAQMRGRLKESDIDLWSPKLPDESYGWVKLSGERLASSAAEEGLRVHVFRPFSGFHSDDQDLTYPWPSYIARARARMDPFDVWGPGTQVRDFIHITDVINGALAAVDADYPGPLNLCTGRGLSFNQLADLVCKSAGYTPQIHHRLGSPVGVMCRVGDTTEMLKVYTPTVTVEDEIGRAVGARG